MGVIVVCFMAVMVAGLVFAGFQREELLVRHRLPFYKQRSTDA